MGRYVIDLASRDALQPALAGGKGAGLAWLHRERANVPPGFVITTEAFREFLAACAPQPARDWPELSADGGDALVARHGRRFHPACRCPRDC